MNILDYIWLIPAFPLLAFAVNGLFGRMLKRTTGPIACVLVGLSFLLSVLGEGTFLNLLSFIEAYAPDTVTSRVAHLALQDEARHVAFGLAHLEHRAAIDPGLLGRLRLAIERRHDALASTAGLNQDVFDALVVLAAGAWTPDAIATGYERVQSLTADMDDGRRRRLARLGFPADEAAELSALHTRNFM